MVKDYVLTLARRDGSELKVSFNASVFRSEDSSVQGVFASLLNAFGPETLVARDGAQASLETIRASGFDGFYPIPIEPARFVAPLEPFLTRPPAGRVTAAT
jgi:hypothetical protein